MKKSTLGLAVATAALAGAGHLAYRLMVRHGRLLLQIEALERELAELRHQRAAPPAVGPADDLPSLQVGTVPPDFDLSDLAGVRSGSTYRPEGRQGSGAPTPGRSSRLNTRWPPAQAQTWSGLPPGTPAPDFRVPTLDGGELTLSQYRGRRVLLVFSDPSYAPCDALAPELEAVQRQAPGLQVLMIGRGQVEANRQKAAQHGLSLPVGVQKGWTVSRMYMILGAPIAFLIDEHGVIAQEVAVGLSTIRALLRSTVIAQADSAPRPWNGEVPIGSARHGDVVQR